MLIVVKYGGNAMGLDARSALLSEVANVHAGGTQVVLVHGGGPQIDDALAGQPVRRVRGLRVTDAATLAMTERVLCGTVNKAIVRALSALGAPAAGISGQDGATLVAEFDSGKENVLGFVGMRPHADPRLILALLAAGFLPVVAPLAVAHDAATALNVNADTAAGAIAGALRADAYVNATNVDCVRLRLDDPASGIPTLSVAAARNHVDSGAFGGGMTPKVESALEALAAGARRAVICGSAAGSLRDALAGTGGTTITPAA